MESRNFKTPKAKPKTQNMSLTFRRAKRADLPTLVQLLADDFLGARRELVSDPLLPGYVAAFEAIAADPNEMLLVADLDGAVVGMLQLSFLRHLTYQGGLRAHIEGVRTRSDIRGQGIGRQLMAHAIETARERGCYMVQLTTDKQRPDAIRFYESLGFEARHEGFKMML
jgi:GNAT superfamily N-acetyltransferase